MGVATVTEATKGLLEQALRLSPIERAELIGELFSSFERHQDDAVEAAWVEEAESRIDAYESGQLRADSAEAVFDRIGGR